MDAIPWPYFLVIRRPRVARDNLRALHAKGVVRGVPTPFQMFMGVLYMLYRLLFRSDTIGVGTPQAVRTTRRARWLRWRPIRFWFLAWERVINPFDLTGYGSRRDFLVRHVVGAYHSGDDAIYDMTLLRAHDGALSELRARAEAVVAEETPHDRFLKDLCVYEGYHENLLAVLDTVEAGIDDPTEKGLPTDSALPAFVDWCLAQPPTVRAAWRAWRAGDLTLDPRGA